MSWCCFFVAHDGFIVSSFSFKMWFDFFTCFLNPA